MQMKIDKFKKLIDVGADIEFRYANVDYTILTIDNSIIVGVQGDDSKDIEFNSSDKVIKDYRIGESNIEDAINEIEILFHS